MSPEVQRRFKRMAEEETVRCRKCRKILITDLGCLLNAHGQKHQGGIHDTDGESAVCAASSERSCLYISEDSYPQFITDAINESSWTKGKLNCTGCQARIGSFNYVSGSHCACRIHIVPQVHLLVSKVDVRRKREALPNPVSYPDRPVALSAAAVESLPILISTGSSTDCNNASLPMTEEALQLCNDRGARATVDQSDIRSPDSVESVDPKPLSGTQSESPRKKNRSEARRRQVYKQLLKRDSDSHLVESAAKSSNFQVLSPADAEEVSLSGDEERDRMYDGIPLHLTCSVCLDLLYSPFVAQPCSHVFCEPCLRRLARPNPTKTCCPLCRRIIGQCMPSRDLAAEVREKFPDMYQERHQFERKHNIQHIPLPWLRNFRMDQLASNRGSLVQRAGGWRTILWMVTVNVLGFGSLAFVRWYLQSQRSEKEKDILEMAEEVDLV